MQNDAIRGNIASNIAVKQYAPEDDDENSAVHYTKNTAIRGHRQHGRQDDRIAANNGLY